MSVLGNLVWHDLNGNGLQDAGEPGIEGAAVELFSSADATVGNADDVSLGVEITDANGLYSFSGLVPATNYNLQFRTPVGNPAFAFTLKDAGGDTIDSDANATGWTAMFTVTGDNLTLDAGLTGGPAPGFGFAIGVGATGLSNGTCRAVATDADGNVYVTGGFLNAADFDPGPGIYYPTTAGGNDIFVAKYSSTGAMVWARQMIGGTSNDFGRGIAVAADGSVYTTGHFAGTADFDPGTGTANLTSAGNGDMFISKLDAAGNLVWVRQIGGTGNDFGLGIALATDGSVYTTGYFEGTVDFDPGAGTVNLISAGSQDVFVSKFDAAGNFVWARRMGGTDADGGNGIAVATDGSVYTTGSFKGTADFDPGAGTSNLISAGYEDVFVSKLDAAGNFVWARRMGGDSLWGDVGKGIAVAADGSVHTTGYFLGIVDFDPGAGVTNLTSTVSGMCLFPSSTPLATSSGLGRWAVQGGPEM